MKMTRGAIVPDKILAELADPDELVWRGLARRDADGRLRWVGSGELLWRVEWDEPET